ncbi:MAG: hypothetical protein K0B81_08505 [Candidatus Cloacimonetes bacterium]|nr:hypothetical protein [Candidatus Cloacimonadota bacterium]
MKQVFNWQIILGIVLIALTVTVYYIHFVIFRDPHHIMIFFFGDLAFVFFEVLLVMLIIHRLLHHREIKGRRNKLNMLIGAFFSEMGTDLLRMLSRFDRRSEQIIRALELPDDWSEQEFLNLRDRARKHDYEIKGSKNYFVELRDLLLERKGFILDLLMNENLIENEAFTNLIWSVFHLTEELDHKKELIELPETEIEHLTEDANRVYQLLTLEWMEYIKHLKRTYPYLFSLAVRKNPFKPVAPVEIK